MNNIKSFMLAGTVALGIGLSILPCYADSVSANASGTTKTTVPKSYLFVMHANNAAITEHNGAYKLSMPNPHIVFFTDRPFRQSGKITVAKFLKDWNVDGGNSFKKNPPNAYIAGLEIVSPKSTNRDVNNVVTMTNPVLANHILSFDINSVSHKKITPVGLSSILAFVDSSCSYQNMMGC